MNKVSELEKFRIWTFHSVLKRKKGVCTWILNANTKFTRNVSDQTLSTAITTNITGLSIKIAVHDNSEQIISKIS